MFSERWQEKKDKHMPNTQFFQKFSIYVCQIHEYRYSPAIIYKGIIIKPDITSN